MSRPFLWIFILPYAIYPRLLPYGSFLFRITMLFIMEGSCVPTITNVFPPFRSQEKIAKVAVFPSDNFSGVGNN
jgi:hypothetical protein